MGLVPGNPGRQGLRGECRSCSGQPVGAGCSAAAARSRPTPSLPQAAARSRPGGARRSPVRGCGPVSPGGTLLRGTAGCSGVTVWRRLRDRTGTGVWAMPAHHPAERASPRRLRGLRKRPRRTPRRLWADRGCDFDKCRRLLWKCGIKTGDRSPRRHPRPRTGQGVLGGRTRPHPHALGRSRKGPATKAPLTCGGEGRPPAVLVTPGQRHDSICAQAPLERIRPHAPVLAGLDAGSRVVREQGLQLSRIPRLPATTRNRTHDPGKPDRQRHRQHRGGRGGRPPAFGLGGLPLAPTWRDTQAVTA